MRHAASPCSTTTRGWLPPHGVVRPDPRVDQCARARRDETHEPAGQHLERGPIVDQSALLDALRSRRIAGAALDVYDLEPLPAGHPLRALDNVVLTPHLRYVTQENYRVFYGEAVEDIAAYLRADPIRVLNA